MAEADETKSFEPFELEKMKLLLSSEYSKLTNEVAARATSQQQLYVMFTTLLVAIGGACFGGYISAWAAIALIVLALVPLGWLWVDYDKDVAKAHIGIKRIEGRVNHFAGEELLEWETKKGRGGEVGKHLI